MEDIVGSERKAAKKEKKQAKKRAKKAKKKLKKQDKKRRRESERESSGAVPRPASLRRRHDSSDDDEPSSDTAGAATSSSAEPAAAAPAAGGLDWFAQLQRTEARKPSVGTIHAARKTTKYRNVGTGQMSRPVAIPDSDEEEEAGASTASQWQCANVKCDGTLNHRQDDHCKKCGAMRRMMGR
tara:strand:- start:240 stop:788 length:549 start_codon:yes stop_codon:yes gene_type:complete